MTAQPDNVRHLRPTPAAEAIAEARAMPPDHLDAILDDEALQPADPAADAWQALLDRGDAIALTDAAFPGGIVAGLLARLDTATRERDQARNAAVTLEQQLSEVERVAVQWTKLHDGVKAGMGHVLLDITRGQRGDDPVEVTR